MGATRKYAVIDPATGKIDRRIFSEQAIYDDEMEKIFGRAWLMIGHESLVPAADDFFHTYMGEDPVILTRDGQGRLHALLNMCRHRGNRVCRVDDGNAKRFMCTYHGWTYRNDGSPRTRPRRVRGLLRRARQAVARSDRGPRRDLRRDRLRDLGQGRPEPRGLSGRRALVSRHRVQSARRRHAGAGPDEMARAGQLEDHGGQLLGQLPRPDQPSLQRPGPDPLPRPPAAVARGPVREPQQARLCQRALDHLPRRGRQHPPLRARHVERDVPAVPGIPRRDDARGRAAARHVARAPGAARQPFDLPERDPRAPAGPAARPAEDRVLAFRAGGPGYARGDSSARSASAARPTTVRPACSSRTTSTTGVR